jgi:hypothetical protein
MRRVIAAFSCTGVLLHRGHRQYDLRGDPSDWMKLRNTSRRVSYFFILRSALCVPGRCSQIALQARLLDLNGHLLAGSCT